MKRVMLPAALLGCALATAVAAAAPSTISVSGTVAGGSGMRVAAVGPAGRVAMARANAAGRFVLRVPVPTGGRGALGLLLVGRNPVSLIPVVLARKGSTGYVRLAPGTRALGTIVRGSGFATVTGSLPEGAYSTAGAVRLRRNGAPRAVPTVFAAVLRPKGRPTDTCATRYWVPNPPGRESGFELIDQLYRQVWANVRITDAQWEALTLPPTWMFWTKNSERQPLATGKFVRSPECPADGQWSYRMLFGDEWMNVTNFISLNQPIDDAGLLTRSVMWKYHQLNYTPGTKVHALTGPDGQVYIETSRDPNRTSDVSPLPAGWTLSPEYVLTKGFTVNLFGDDIANIRMTNGDSYQGPMAPGFTLAQYAD